MHVITCASILFSGAFRAFIVITSFKVIFCFAKANRSCAGLNNLFIAGLSDTHLIARFKGTVRMERQKQQQQQYVH